MDHEQKSSWEKKEIKIRKKKEEDSDHVWGWGGGGVRGCCTAGMRHTETCRLLLRLLHFNLPLSFLFRWFLSNRCSRCWREKIFTLNSRKLCSNTLGHPTQVPTLPPLPLTPSFPVLSLRLSLLPKPTEARLPLHPYSNYDPSGKPEGKVRGEDVSCAAFTGLRVVACCC